jgi:hypothetical protein
MNSDARLFHSIVSLQNHRHSLYRDSARIYIREHLIQREVGRPTLKDRESVLTSIENIEKNLTVVGYVYSEPNIMNARLDASHGNAQQLFLNSQGELEYSEFIAITDNSGAELSEAPFCGPDCWVSN